MVKVATILFRESLEIFLIIGIFLSVAKFIKNSKIYIVIGCILGALASIFFGILIQSLKFLSQGSDIINLCLLSISMLMISSVIFLVQDYSSNIKNKIGNLRVSNDLNSSSASSGSVAGSVTGCGMSIAGIVAIAVLREGVEIVLFVYGIFISQSISFFEMMSGVFVGTLFGLFVGFLFYIGVSFIKPKFVFNLSSIILILIAASLASDIAKILTSSGMIEFMSDDLFANSRFFEYMSLSKMFTLGNRILPTRLQALFYFVSLSANLLILYFKSNSKKVR